ncbi:PASTA domain-containing protein [Streptacidiphilus jiangxiensis]|uniref:PASTA domain-containing protein n=1 Tax=Streptacidiphilus jiangxiensis TaxID=235985 RepID=A0A1H7HE61_STRJI|nr:PASTA domain-containing protein [Streptacidiphilus jiangxiensis]
MAAQLLSVTTLKLMPDPTQAIAAGQVVATQDPQAHTAVVKGTTVTVTYSDPPPPRS